MAAEPLAKDSLHAWAAASLEMLTCLLVLRNDSEQLGKKKNNSFLFYIYIDFILLLVTL